MLTTSEVAKALGVSSATVRNYTQKFGNHLSAGANGRPRRFSDDDLRILNTARSLLAEGLRYEETNERLAVVDLEELEPLPEPEPETALVPVTSFRALMETYVQPYVQERDRVLAERNELLQEVREQREEIGHLRGQLEILQRQERKSWLQRLLGR